MKTKDMNYEAWAIYNEGKRAFTNGLDDLDNPHRAGLKSHKLWSAGWHDAAREYIADGGTTREQRE